MTLPLCLTQLPPFCSLGDDERDADGVGTQPYHWWRARPGRGDQHRQRAFRLHPRQGQLWPAGRRLVHRHCAQDLYVSGGAMCAGVFGQSTSDNGVRLICAAACLVDSCPRDGCLPCRLCLCLLCCPSPPFFQKGVRPALPGFNPSTSCSENCAAGRGADEAQPEWAHAEAEKHRTGQFRSAAADTSGNVRRAGSGSGRPTRRLGGASSWVTTVSSPLACCCGC